MGDARSEPEDAASGDATTDTGGAETAPESDVESRSDGDPEPDAESLSTEELRRQVEEEYDFDSFGPSEMASMSAEEWEAAFDPETWITGEELLDRIEADVKARVLRRDVFARVERLARPDRVVAYSDEGYALVYGDGTVEGMGTVLRDVKPSVALCSMEEYDVPEAPDGDLLPQPMEVPEGSGEFGNLMVQVIAGALVLSGVVLGGAALVTGDIGVIAGTVGLLFLVAGGLLFFTVANARLSDRFRAEEYRNRLRAVGPADGERPDFLPESARGEPKLEGERGDEETAEQGA
ncbi:hypothetical protein [Halosegnis sp.]|uniref:DUF7319 domain-containing protein n=1 Tax=Halosegnis sp. TaxID=2864959 RepID=UPI0035D47CB6